MDFMKPIYLDYAAATPMSQAVIDAMAPFASDVFYNPSATYTGAREAKSALDNARNSVSQSLGARPSEIIFTAGGTESDNLAIFGVAGAFPNGNIITTTIEHDAVLNAAKQLSAKLISVDKSGIANVEELESKINDQTVLISVMYANNEIGTVQPINAVVELVKKVRKVRKLSGNNMPLYVHTDACQAPLYLDINVARLGVDLMTLNGGKIYGPKQSGILYHRSGVILEPRILGGGQEFGYRSGTENVAACVGFAKALELSLINKKENSKRVKDLAQSFMAELEKRFGAVINGNRKLRLPNNIHATFPNCDNERVIFSLDNQGVFVAAGSACSASNEQSSHVLLAIGLSDQDARSSIRFTLGLETTKQDLDDTLKFLQTALHA
jgi:cysteine desulfurase